MYASLLIGLAVAVGTPGAKDPPKKEASIVGVWVQEKLIEGGKDESDRVVGEVRMTFTEDGKVLRKGGREEGTYKVDPKKDPAQLDITGTAGEKDSPLLAIYKVEGDTLTICFEYGKEIRLTKLESTAGSKIVLMTFKRAKKK